MLMFYVLSLLAVYGALQAVLRTNPVTCALHLALAMTALSGLFFKLGAHFIAGVQLAVYAGAVMVLFVMVIMLFDSSSAKSEAFKINNFDFFKAVLCAVGFGILSGTAPHSIGVVNKLVLPEAVSTKSLAGLLFSEYVFLFEWLGLLLLIIAVGVVVLSRGGDKK